MRNKRLSLRVNNWIIYIFLSIVVAATIITTYWVIDFLRKEEIKRIELFATAMKYQQKTFIEDPIALDLILQISKSNTSVPVIITDATGKPLGTDYMKNIPQEVMQNPQKLQKLLNVMKASYKPFELKLPGGNQYVYYTNSKLLNDLRYSPVFLGILVLAYLAFSFWFLKTIKRTDEGFLWAGLAKETAHQIGTPLSSMIGWTEILKMENPDSEGVKEIEKDIYRLKTISERFSKIGSVPERNDLNLNETVQQNYDYLKTRISKKIEFKLNLPKKDVFIPHNKILISWVVENLVKNAVDAMKGIGKLEISLYERNKLIILDFKDSGCGMTLRQARKVFKPGFSTKKRGWGLGLSLANRVISEYHKGDIKIAQTEPGKGTTFRIVLKKA